MDGLTARIGSRLWPRDRGASHNLLTLVLVGLAAGIGAHNAATYPSWAGFDAAEYVGYARGLVEDGSLGSSGAGYTPPGYFGLAGVGLKLFEALGAAEPEKAGQWLNLLLLIGTALLVLAVATTLMPRRPVAQNAALGFFCLLPVVLKTYAMFHPQPLVTFLGALALLLVTRTIASGRYGWRPLVGLALTVAAAQLVRSVALWIAIVVIVSLLAAAACGRLPRRQTLTGLGALVGGLLVLAVPWWVYLQRNGGNALLGRGLSIWPDPSLWPLRFWVGGGWPDVITHPQRFGLQPRFLSHLYVETWGDYFGIWSWGAASRELSGSVDDRLAVQSAVGLVPSVVAVAGWLAAARLTAGRIRERAEWLPTLLFPPIALLGAAYYASKAFSPDGDTVKALFLLPAIPAVAVSFGLAVDVLVRRGGVVRALTVVALAVAALACIEFGIR